MKNSHNKFQHNSNSKLGMELKNSANLTNIMKAGISTAIPIWQMLGLTEEEYNEKYHKQPVKDASNNDETEKST